MRVCDKCKRPHNEADNIWVGPSGVRIGTVTFEGIGWHWQDRFTRRQAQWTKDLCLDCAQVIQRQLEELFTSIR